jgi:hypothetical protein
VNADHRTLSALKGRTPIGGGDSRGCVVAFERQIIGDSDTFDAWQRRDARKELVEELRGTGLFGIPDAGEVHPHGNHAIGVEAGFYLQELNEAADKKAGSDEKNKRQGDFTDDKQIAEATMRQSRGGTAAAFLEEFSKSLPPCCERRGEAKQQAGKERHTQGETEDAKIY